MNRPQTHQFLLLPAVGAARIFLRLAILTIRLMQWLYNHHLIKYNSTDRFFRFAKRLEMRAGRIMSHVE